MADFPLEEHWHGYWNQSYDIVAQNPALASEESSGYIGYDARTGNVTVGRFKYPDEKGGFDPVWSGIWARGLTSLAPLDRGEDNYLLSYRASDGKFRIDRVEQNVEQGIYQLVSVSAQTWPRGLASVDVFRVDGTDYIYAWNASTAQVSLKRLYEDMSYSDLWKPAWVPYNGVWTTFFRLPFGGDDYIFWYNIETGKFSIQLFNPDPKHNCFNVKDEGSISPKLTAHAALGTDGRLFSYSSEYGLTQVRDFNPVAKSYEEYTVTGDAVGSGYTSILPFFIADYPDSGGYSTSLDILFYEKGSALVKAYSYHSDTVVTISTVVKIPS